MSFFNSIKRERDKRKQEEQEAASVIEKERERIRQKRQEAREHRSFIRKKIKFVDKVASQKEDNKDKEELARVQLEQANRINAARKERRNKAISRNKGKLVASGIVCLAVIFGGIFTANQVQEHNELERYNTAVEYILEENYEQAGEILQEISTEDSEQLLAYTEVQQDIDSYNGEPGKFESKLDKINNIDNSEVKAQIKEADENINEAEDVQESIDKIDVKTVNLESKDAISEISEQVSNIDDRYVTLVDTEALESAETTIEHLEKNDDVGKTINAINEIGEVTLDSEGYIEQVRSAVDDLTIVEREDVVNLADFQYAESTLSSMKRQKAEEEKAEQERIEAEAKTAAEQTRSTPESSSDFTVYWTPNGEVYHLRNSCRTLARSKTIYSGPLSSCPKERACKVCGN